MRVCTGCQRLVPAGETRCPDDNADTESVDTLPPGTRVGSYRVVGELGEGGMGSVFEATHEVLGRRSAIKLLHPELAANPELVARFLQEAKAVNLIDHDHIVNVYDFSDGDDGAVYFVMEYLDGEPFDEYLKRKQRVALDEFFTIFDQILRALSAAHAKQIVHRDLKPANVFLVKRGDERQAKLLDFGVAKLTADDAQGLTAAGALIGTPHFMSPEQWAGKPVDVRSDIFAIGIMMFRALCGKLPFDGRDLGELAAQVTREPTPKLTAAAPDLERGSELEAIVSKALARRPADRYQSVDELRSDLWTLDPASSERPAETAPPPIARPTAAAKSRRPIGKWIIAGAAALALIAGGAVAAAKLLSAGDGGDQAATGADAGPPTIADRFRTGGRAAAGEASRAALREALASDDRALRDAALEAIELVEHPALAPLLYRGLAGDPEMRARSARVLGAIALPDAAPRLREALAESSDRLRVVLALALVASGDRDGVAILADSLDEPAHRLRAAVALAELDGREEAVAVLREIAANSPAGRARWREASRVLLGLGDREAKKALVGELSNKDPVRRLQAAWVLAGAGVDQGRELLERAVESDDPALRSTAALALAELGLPAGERFVATGLASSDPTDRARAAAVAARLGITDRAAQLAAATEDSDIDVKLTASAALVALARGD